MELLQLRYFQTAARLESITLAAEHHTVPQSSMSQTIRRLENDLGGIKLFDRKNGRIYLNEQGRIFLDYVDATLANLDGGIRAVSTVSGKVEGTVRIKVMENHRLVLTCVPAFLKIYPNVHFSISHGYHEEKDADYDLCISSETSFRHLNESKPLLDERSLRVTATLLSAARQYGLADVTGIQLGQKTNIRLMWKNQIEVVLGNESNLALQIKALVGILPTLLNNNGEGATGRLDMRSYADGDAANDRAIFSPMTLEELQGTNEVPSDVTTPNESVDGTGETGKTDGTTEAETPAATAGTTLPAAA